MDAMVGAGAALIGAIIGGILSVLASWIAQRVQSRTQLLSQEIKRRQQLYSEFVQAASRCYADALQENEPEPGTLSKVYGEIGRMRLYSSERVVSEANAIARTILDAYSGSNRSRAEIRDFLASDSVDLFSAFGDACREELAELEPNEAPKYTRLKPKDAPLRLTPGETRELTRPRPMRGVATKDPRRG